MITILIYFIIYAKRLPPVHYWFLFDRITQKRSSWPAKSITSILLSKMPRPCINCFLAGLGHSSSHSTNYFHNLSLWTLYSHCVALICPRIFQGASSSLLETLLFSQDHSYIDNLFGTTIIRTSHPAWIIMKTSNSTRRGYIFLTVSSVCHLFPVSLLLARSCAWEIVSAACDQATKTLWFNVTHDDRILHCSAQLLTHLLLTEFPPNWMWKNLPSHGPWLSQCVC